MKVKIIITSCLFLIVLSNTAKAQTKEETEKWIVEKVNKYMKAKSVKIKDTKHGWLYTFDYIPTKFSFQNSKITISYSLAQYSENPGYVNKTLDSNPNYVTEAFIYSIKNIITEQQCTDNPSTNTRCYGNSSLLVISLSCNCGTRSDIKKSSTETVSNIYLFIDGNEEPDLSNRLQSAFDKLKTFYPKPKETF